MLTASRSYVPGGGRLKHILGIIFFTLSLVCISAAEGLSGAERNSFVKAGYESCTKSQTANPVNASLSVEKLGQYCTCFANRFADNTPPNDLKVLNAQTVRDPAAIVIKIKPLVKA